MAKKRSKKGAQYQGGRSVTLPGKARNDVLSRDAVLARLREIPVFGLKSGDSFVTEEDGATRFYMEAREAERACDAKRREAGSQLCAVEGVPLSDVYFDRSTPGPHMVLSHTVHLPLGALLTWWAMYGAGPRSSSRRTMR